MYLYLDRDRKVFLDMGPNMCASYIQLGFFPDFIQTLQQSRSYRVYDGSRQSISLSCARVKRSDIFYPIIIITQASAQDEDLILFFFFFFFFCGLRSLRAIDDRGSLNVRAHSSPFFLNRGFHNGLESVGR